MDDLKQWKYSYDLLKYINIETGTEFDTKGFDKYGIHKDTRTRFDLEGYDKEGYDEQGYDKSGYDRDGYNKKGYDREGYSREGYDRERHDRNGFDINGIHKDTGTRFDLEGYDKKGFNKECINKDTGTMFDVHGYNKKGYDKDGYDRKGFAKNGYNRYGFNRRGYDRDGYNKKGYDREGYDRDGYNKKGYDREGYNRKGFNKQLIYKETKTHYDSDGFDWRGRDKDGYNRDGFDIEGYDRQGYDREGFNRKGIHRDTKTEYDPDGFNREGYDNEGYNREGLDKTGKNRNERQEIQTIQRKNYLGLINKAEKLASGQMTIEEYISKSKYSIEELIEFAKKQHLSPDVIRGLHKLKQQYKLYTTPFNKKQYLKITAIMIDGKLVKPTEQDVDICINYLRKKGTRICSFTVQDTIRQYLRGEIEIPQENMSNGVTNKTELEKLEEEQQRLTEQLKDIKRLEKQVTQAEGEKKTICIGE